MNRKNQAPDISYFRLSLMAFLAESHPERLKDNRFILSCTDAAIASYEQAILNGDTPEEAIEQANTVLFDGLHFSKHDTLVNILWNEFADEVPEYEAKEMAIRLLPECESVFSGYPLPALISSSKRLICPACSLRPIARLYFVSHKSGRIETLQQMYFAF